MGHLTGQISRTMRRIAQAEEIVRGIRYQVADAALIAHDGKYDIVTGDCDRPPGCAMFLFRGINGHFFTLRLTDWQDETDTIEPCSIGDAMTIYRDLKEKVLTWEEAFPEVKVQEA
jgi:hypothetical protein